MLGPIGEAHENVAYADQALVDGMRLLETLHVGREYLVELESVILTNVLADDDDEALPVGEDVDGGMPRHGAVRGQKGP